MGYFGELCPSLKQSQEAANENTTLNVASGATARKCAPCGSRSTAPSERSSARAEKLRLPPLCPSDNVSLPAGLFKKILNVYLL